MKLGARVVKTGVAIVFALFLADILTLPSPVFAGIAAIFAIQPSIYRSYLSIIEQIQANLIGAAIAVIFALVFGNNFIAVGLAAVITIALMLKFKYENSIPLALVTIIAIMEFEGENFTTFSIIRFSTIIVGVVAAFLVNLIFMPPKYETRLFNKIHRAQEELMRWIRLAIRQASDHNATKQTIETMRAQIMNLDQLYSLYQEERSYFRKEQRSKARKLVVYRQMITVTKTERELLKRLHAYENELSTLEDQLKMTLQQRVEQLLTHNDQLLLKYAGKLKAEHSELRLLEELVEKQEIMHYFAKELRKVTEEDSVSAYHLMHVLSALLHYEEQLEHLDKLISSHQAYHGEEIDVDLEVEI